MLIVEILTAPGWGKCQAARALVVKLVEEAKTELPDLRLEEVDVTEHPEVAVKYGVMSTPALAISGKLEFLGVPREDTLRARLRAAAERGS